MYSAYMYPLVHGPIKNMCFGPRRSNIGYNLVYKINDTTYGWIACNLPLNETTERPRSDVTRQETPRGEDAQSTSNRVLTKTGNDWMMGEKSLEKSTHDVHHALKRSRDGDHGGHETPSYDL